MNHTVHLEAARAAFARAAWARGLAPYYDDEAIIDRHFCRQAGNDYECCGRAALRIYRNEERRAC